MSGIDFARLNALIKQLGLAALDPAMWPALMQDICIAVNTTGAGLLQSDVRTADIPTTESTRELFKFYFDNDLHIHDIRARRGAPKLLNGAKVIADQDLFESERELLQDPLYAALGTQGFRWWSAVGFRAGDAHWGLALQRTTQEGMFGAEELAALATLSDRLTETATLSKAVGRQVLTGMTNAFALVSQPAVALDRFGHVTEVNQGALAIFDDEFRVRNRRLFVRDLKAKPKLDRLVDQLRVKPDFEAIDHEPVVVHRTGKWPVILRVLPVDGAARSPFLGARAIVLLTEVGRAKSANPVLLQSIFGLTAAEARLGALLASGLSLEDVAEQLGVKKETVRNQLKSVFAKTGTNRQSQLVALLVQVG